MKNLLITIISILFGGFAQADSKPYKGKFHQIPGKIEAEHYDEGAPGMAYHDVDKKNHGADYREATQVDICLLYTSPSPRDRQKSRMPSSA